jgi:hypothetical protein
MRALIVEKIEQTHARNWDEWWSGGTKHSCAGRHANPMAATVLGRWEIPSHYTTLIASEAWHPDVAKVCCLAELCGVWLNVETYNNPKGPLQCKRC